MKGSASSIPSLVLVLALAGGCASPSRPPAMPAWSPDTVALVAAAAPVDIDDDEMRVPRTEEEQPDTWHAAGLYLGGALISSQPLGDFDGDFALFGPTDALLVPDVDVGAGVGAYVSYRWYANELLLQYSITEHDGDFDGSPREHDTTFYDLDFNWRHYFLEQTGFQPYALLGVGWARAKIENGSTDQATGTVFEDAELQDGVNFNLGGGVAVYPLPWLVLFGQGMYRFVRYESSSGIDGHLSNTPDVDGDGWNISFGAALRVLPPRD